MAVRLANLGRLGQCPVNYFWDYEAGPDVCVPGDTTSDDGSSSFWDRIFQVIDHGGSVATNIIRAEQGGYITPQGRYPYGTGPYSALSYPQAQTYLRYQQGHIGGAGTIDVQTLLMIGLAGLVIFMVMGRR